MLHVIYGANLCQKILNSNLTGPPGFFLLSKSGNLSKGRHAQPGAGGPEVLFMWSTLLTVVLLPAL